MSMPLAQGSPVIRVQRTRRHVSLTPEAERSLSEFAMRARRFVGAAIAVRSRADDAAQAYREALELGNTSWNRFIWSVSQLLRAVDETGVDRQFFEQIVAENADLLEQRVG